MLIPLFLGRRTQCDLINHSTLTSVSRARSEGIFHTGRYHNLTRAPLTRRSLLTAIALALLHCAKLGQAGSLIRVGQIVRVSSSKAAWTRRLTVCSVPSS
jgi:hypothetical protein